MREEINRLETDLKNTNHELANIAKMKRHLKWFVVLGVLTSPIGMFWHFSYKLFYFWLVLRPLRNVLLYFLRTHKRTLTKA